MTISFKTGTSGWANYVVNGTTQKPRDKSKIEVIDNDPFFVEKIASQNKFSGEYYKGVISVEKKISNKEMIEIYEEFKKELFVGLKEDEYIISAVIHQDTDYTHLHFDIPKQNLLTGQHLQLYMHGIDTKRIDLIADDIAIRHNLKTKEEIKPTIKPSKEYSFEKQRAERNQEPYNFTLTNKKDKALAQQQVTELLKSNIENINNLDDVKAFIHSNTDLKVIKSDFDRKKQFHYITIQDTSDKKTRVQGDLFSEAFFKQPKQEQLDQLEINHKTFSETEKEAYAKQVRANLKREREKRFKKVSNQGRKLKLSIRQEQRQLNNTIRKEYENPRRTTTTSTERSKRATRQPSRQQTPTLAERAIFIEAERIKAIKKIRESREKLLIRTREANKELQERYTSNTADIRAKYEAEHSRSTKPIRSLTERFKSTIRATINTIKSKLKFITKTKQNNELNADTELTQEQEKEYKKLLERVEKEEKQKTKMKKERIK